MTNDLIGGAALYHGRVMHRRLRPVSHRLDYRVFSMLIDLGRLDELDKRLKYFSRNRFNLFSFHDRDHGAGAPCDLAEWVRDVLRDEGLPADGAIRFLFYPRILGYAFNPLSVFYCHDATGDLVAIIYAVRNTFGGRHAYLIPVEPGATGADVRQAADKVFHVSPFMEMATRYHFRLSRPDARILVAIRQHDAAGPIFNAVFAGEAEPVTDGALKRAFFRYPLMTVKIILGIHWEALRLLAKGMRLLPGAPDPAHPVTVVRLGDKGRAEAPPLAAE